MRNRLSNCDKEDCWLSEIQNNELRKKIDDYVFSPDSPPRWDDNSNEENTWLYSDDFLKIFYQYEKRYKCFKFIGPSAIDFDKKPTSFNGQCVENDLCNFSLKDQLENKITKIGIVFNLDKHDEDGSHWVSMFINIKQGFIFYFESQIINDKKEDVPSEVSIFKDRIIKQGKELQNPIDFTFYTTNKLHQHGNTECGMYSLYFIITLLTEKINNKHVPFEKLLKLFRKKRIPDKYINEYRKIYFNKK